MTWEPGKPTDSENEYFARQDAEWLKARRAELDEQRKAREIEEARLHCPRCSGRLTERMVGHVTLDACGQCHGVWFDAGELELLTHVSRADIRRAIRLIDTGAQ